MNSTGYSHVRIRWEDVKAGEGGGIFKTKRETGGAERSHNRSREKMREKRMRRRHDREREREKETGERRERDGERE